LQFLIIYNRMRRYWQLATAAQRPQQCALSCAGKFGYLVIQQAR